MTASGPELIEDIIDVETANGTMAVLRKRPRAGKHPAVVMFHDGPGIRNATHVFARELAGAGYEVVVPDLYHRHGRMIGFEPHEREADPSLVDRLWQLLATLDDNEIQHDLDLMLSSTGLDQRDRLGTIGFCLGARATFRTMMRLPDRFVAGAMWHPSFLCDDEPGSPHLTASGLRGGLFIGIGEEDQMQPLEGHQPFLDAIAGLATVKVQVYPGADHGYTWKGWPNYHRLAAEDSFARTHRLFQSLLD